MKRTRRPENCHGSQPRTVKQQPSLPIEATTYIESLQPRLHQSAKSSAQKSLDQHTNFKLTGRSVWNSQWLLIIPESELAGDKSVDGIDVLIHGPTGKGGISDLKLLLTSYGYSGCSAADVQDAAAHLEVSESEETNVQLTAPDIAPTQER